MCMNGLWDEKDDMRVPSLPNRHGLEDLIFQELITRLVKDMK